MSSNYMYKKHASSSVWTAHSNNNRDCGSPPPPYLSAVGSEQRATMLYTGAMEKGQMHGKGALVYPNSEKYEVRGRRRVRPEHVAERR